MLSRRTVSKLIEPLELFGLIAVKRSKVPGSKLNAPHTCTLLKVGKLIPYGMREASKVAQNGRKKEKNTLSSLRSERTPVSRKPAISSFPSGLVPKEQEEAIHYYNEKLVPLGWFKVNKLSPSLEDALGAFDAGSCNFGFETGDIRALVDGVRENSPDVTIPRRKTLVRLIWAQGEVREERAQ
jgi:hypothetical protein